MEPNQKVPPAETTASWPYKSLLLLGTFGSNDAAGRQYTRQCWRAVTFLVIVIVLLNLVNIKWPQYTWLPTSLFGAIFIYIAFALWQYITRLDELARRLQLEAMALTYLVGFAAFLFAGTLGLSFKWTFSPLWYVALEGVRGLVLVVLARRYR